jgi:hypothetical protein
MKSIFLRQLIVALGLSVATSCCTAQESKYLGVWNYDQPSGATSENMARIQCPAPKSQGAMQGFTMMLPQIGNLTLSKSAEGYLKGQTDQGCTWTFKIGAESAELEPASQTCFNKVIGSSYTIDHWSIRVDGRQASETLTAKSHLAFGECDFALQKGKRTKADDTDSSALFVGAWRYDATPPQTRLNIAQQMCGENAAKRAPVSVPQTGIISISKTSENELTAATPDGCSWKLKVQGNTAILDSPQSCERKDDAAVTMNHWTIASDGQHQFTIMSSTQTVKGESCTSVLGTGSLTRASSIEASSK